MFCMYQLNNCFLFYYIIGDTVVVDHFCQILFLLLLLLFALLQLGDSMKKMTSGMKGRTKQRYDAESLLHTEILHLFKFIDSCWTITEKRHDIKTVKRWVMHFSNGDMEVCQKVGGRSAYKFYGHAVAHHCEKA